MLKIHRGACSVSLAEFSLPSVSFSSTMLISVERPEGTFSLKKSLLISEEVGLIDSEILSS